MKTNSRTIQIMLYIINICIIGMGIISFIVLVEKLPLMLYFLIPITYILFIYHIKSNNKKG